MGYFQKIVIMPKTKRYNGRENNVALNLFFEQYMESVATEKKKILAYLPTGFVSRSKASREFGLCKQVQTIISFST